MFASAFSISAMIATFRCVSSSIERMGSIILVSLAEEERTSTKRKNQAKDAPGGALAAYHRDDPLHAGCQQA